MESSPWAGHGTCKGDEHLGSHLIPHGKPAQEGRLGGTEKMGHPSFGGGAKAGNTKHPTIKGGAYRARSTQCLFSKVQCGVCLNEWHGDHKGTQPTLGVHCLFIDIYVRVL